MKDRITIVGPNGIGKTTLLRIISGFNQDFLGKVIISKHTTIGYLPQEEIKLNYNTLYEEVLSAAEDLNKIKIELDEIQEELSQCIYHNSNYYYELIEKFGELQEKYKFYDGYNIKSNIEKILSGLGFKQKDFCRFTYEFSGGLQMRIELAKLLLKKPSVLLLDEPTNHLDINSLLWLENYLTNYKGAILIVSHDINFLDKIVNKTIEISNSKLIEYRGNYSEYIFQKQKKIEILKNKFQEQEKYLEQQKKFIERFRYKATKSRAVQSRIKMIERIEKIIIDDFEDSIKFNFPESLPSGKVVLEVSNLSKSFEPEKIIFADLNLIINRGDKIAVIGDNGSGKSTLARIIAGREKVYSGEIKYGYNIVLKYFAQNQWEELNSNKSIIEVMTESASAQISDVRNILGCFLFKGDDVYKSVNILSGGEKSRLALAKLLLEPSNFLILDEPTNHLDIKSKSILKKALMDYNGSILIVSHDRYFLSGLVNKVLEVKDKRIITYLCDINEVIKIKQKKINGTFKAENEYIENSNNGSLYFIQLEKKKIRKQNLKNVKNLQNEIDDIFKKLLVLEERKKNLEKEMLKKEFYKDANYVVEINQEYKDIENKINELNYLWELKFNQLEDLKSKL